MKIDVLMELHQKQPSKGYNGQALETSDRARARGLLDTLTEPNTNIRKGVEPKLLESERTTQQKLDGIVDLTDPQVQAICAIASTELSYPWKDIWLVQKKTPPNWDLASRLIAENFAGIRVPSMRHFSGVNIVLWSWNDRPER